MFWRRAMSAAGALALLAAASWLPARASGGASGLGAAVDLARPTLPAPATWPAHPAGPVDAVSAFLWSLSAAVAGKAGPPSAASTTSAASTATPANPNSVAPEAPATSSPGAVGGEVALPFARAYAYLAPGWQARQPFAEFVRNWTPVRHLDPLAIIAAGAPPDGDPKMVRVFAEVRILDVTGGNPGHVALSFADGFFLADPTPQGWLLESGSLQPEDFGLLRPTGGNASPEATAEASARALAARLGRTGASGAARVRLESRPDHQAHAWVHLGQDVYSVRLYQLADAQWVSLSVQR